MSEYLLKAENLSKSYGDKLALQQFGIQIPKGSIYGLLGPNGAGKTTFIRMINQITQPDEGNILFKGETLAPHHIKEIGYMPEERGLYKNMKVGEQCIYLARLKGLSKKEAQDRLHDWFDRLHIDKWWDKKLSELSKGMAQKIQFVVTVLHNPSLLIFDEPFSGFDPINANIIRDEIVRLRDLGATIIFSTHRMESVEQLCDYVALINNSIKIIDDKIDIVRDQYKEGKYQVEIQVTDASKWSQFQHNFALEDLQTLKNGHQAFVAPIEQFSAPNSFFSSLIEIGNIITYDEIIPSMNDVFITAVEQNN